jgi:dCMP deaminase
MNINLTIKKRENYISWHEYFMSLADLSSKRSKDPRTVVGACIVNENNIVVGLGYNGLSFGIDDEEINWSREEESPNNKYDFVVHAEVNAILNSNSSVRGCILYTNKFPCVECSKIISQSRIKKVIYQGDIPNDIKGNISKFILEKGNIEIEKY